MKSNFNKELVSHDQTISEARSGNKNGSCGWDSHIIFLLTHVLGLPEMMELTHLRCFFVGFPHSISYRNMVDLELSQLQLKMPNGCLNLRQKREKCI